MRTAPAALALVVAADGAMAQQRLPTVPELLTAELKASQDCEAAGDPSVTHEQCRLHDRLSGRLAQAGLLLGPQGTDRSEERVARLPAGLDLRG